MSLKLFRHGRGVKKRPRRRDPPPTADVGSASAATAIVAHGVAVVEKSPERLGPGPRELLEHFLQNKSKNTLDAYRRDLKAFAEHADEETPLDAVRELLGAGHGGANAIVLGWLNAMAQKGLSSSTRARRLGTIRSLVKLARLLGLVDWSIDVQNPKVESYRDTRGPALEAIHRMLDTCGDDLEGKRNRVIVLMLTALGLRRSELVALRESDYDRDGERVHVIGKGNKEVWITTPPIVMGALDSWLAASADLRGGDDDPPLVCSFQVLGSGAPLSREGLNYIVKQIGERAGVKAWPHGLRHAGITLGLDGGHHIRDVRRFSRHSDVRTVMIYDDNREDLGAGVAKTVSEKLVKRGSTETK